MIYDVIIIGSGPAGVNAAAPLVEAGWTVAMLDVGNEPGPYGSLIPGASFSEIRRSDDQQHRYFLGEQFEGIPLGKLRVGAQLTPPRQHVFADVQRLMPILSESFAPLESLAQGGLGCAWGANVFPFNELEFARMPIRRAEIAPHYEVVANRIGISGKCDDLAPLMGGYPSLMPGLRIDSNSESLRRQYERGKPAFNRQGFFLGQTPLAVCTRPHPGRTVHRYHDMDFWDPADRSVYRPRWTLEELQRSPNFRYINHTFVLSFEDRGRLGVEVFGVDSQSHQANVFRARSVVLAAGTISTARIVLRSLRQYKTRVPLLCNPYTYVPVINSKMLGRQPRDERHSLAQLTAIYIAGKETADAVQTQFYSYRSLLTFKLLKESPLGCAAGIKLFRLLMNSIGILAINHADSVADSKYCELRRGAGRAPDTLKIEYSLAPEVELQHQSRERVIRRMFRWLGCWHLGTIRPGHGSSIHYAGTFPMSTSERPLTCDRDCRLRGTQNVFLADGSVLPYLPAKGLTFTIMANANRVGEHVGQCLLQRSERIAS